MTAEALCSCWHEPGEHERDGTGQPAGPCMVAVSEWRYVDGKAVGSVVACPCEAFVSLPVAASEETDG